jgi:c-di-GMP-binding flagellar brake protein YcgR
MMFSPKPIDSGKKRQTRETKKVTIPWIRKAVKKRREGMDTDFIERRQHIRVYFDSLDETNCRFVIEGKGVKSLSASVLDLSLGGLHLAVTGDLNLAVGDRLLLNYLKHRTGPVCVEQIPLEIRWVYSRAESRYFYLGCQFLHLSEKSRSRIANLISLKLLEASAVRLDRFDL